VRLPRLCSIRNISLAITIPLAMAIAAPASADFFMPSVPGFSNSYPWFNEVAQYPGNQSFQYFLAYHPNIARALSLNPALLYDARWRSQNPQLEQYLANHPYEWQELNGQDWAEGSCETSWGAYDDEHQWRDAYWWHRNRPDWFYDNHQTWASLDSRWLGEDGAYDPQHQWHYGEWWYNQNPAWVTANHPGWLSEHKNWEAPSEQATYRQQHAMPVQNQPNQQRPVDQRQASLEPHSNPPINSVPQQQEKPQRTEQTQQRPIDQRQAKLEPEPNVPPKNQSQQPEKREPSQTAERQTQPPAHQTEQHQSMAREQEQHQQPQSAHEQQPQHEQSEPGQKDAK